MLEVGQKVLVTDSIPAPEGIIEKVSTWAEQLNLSFAEGTCYFVRVPEWDHGTNGGRWLASSHVKAI